MLCPECRVCGSSQLLISHAQLHAQSCHAQLSQIFCAFLSFPPHNYHFMWACFMFNLRNSSFFLCPAVGLTTVPFPYEIFLTLSNLNLNICEAKKKFAFINLMTWTFRYFPLIYCIFSHKVRHTVNTRVFVVCGRSFTSIGAARLTWQVHTKCAAFELERKGRRGRGKGRAGRERLPSKSLCTIYTA